MTSIIQSNRERKSRLDEGLVERLNNKKPAEGKRDVSEKFEENMPINVPDLRLMQYDKLIKEIVNYMKNQLFPYDEGPYPIKYDKGTIWGNTYTTIITDMYLKSINSSFRVARLIEMEQNPYFLDLANTGITNVGIASTDKEFIKFNIRGCNFSSVFMDLRGLELNKRGQLQFTSELRYTQADWMRWQESTGYSKIDDFGLPLEPDPNSKRKILRSNERLVVVQRSDDRLYANSPLSYTDAILTKIVLCKVRP